MDRTVTERIDRWLSSAIAAWEGLPGVERGIDGWDREDQLDFLADWGSKEHQLDVLRRAAGSGEMTEGQLREMGTLEGVVAKNRPIIERLLLT